MLFMLLKYHFLKTIRSRETMFWSFAFPIILGTLFYAAFSGFTNEEIFHEIPVAYIEEEGQDEYFEQFLKEMQDGDDALIAIKRVSQKEAEELLQEEEIVGIYYNKDKLSLTVLKEGSNQSILKMLLEEYEIKKNTIAAVAMAHPENIENILDEMEADFLKDQKLTDGNMDMMTNYFYALIAMSCLYGSFLGITAAFECKANISPIAIRRIAASTNRFLILISDVLVNIFIQSCFTFVSVCYLKFVLNIDLGSQFPLIMLTVFMGSVIGVSTGFLIGAVGTWKKEIKTGISIAFTMLECFLSGLMIDTIYTTIENNVPILNRINPASLIVDSLYSLNIYDTHERFIKNMIYLLVIAIVLIVLSFLAVRRERYASL